MRVPTLLGLGLLSALAVSGCQLISGVSNLKVDGAAGGGGAGGGPVVCAGDECSSYCSAIRVCTDDFRQYDSDEECCATCNVLQAAGSLSCRAARLTEAADPTESVCSVAGPTGFDKTPEGGCNDDPCGTFCAAAEVVCPNLFADASLCAQVCGQWTKDKSYGVPLAPEMPGSLACHMLFLTRATVDPDACSQAGMDGLPCNP